MYRSLVLVSTGSGEPRGRWASSSQTRGSWSDHRGQIYVVLSPEFSSQTNLADFMAKQHISLIFQSKRITWIFQPNTFRGFSGQTHLAYFLPKHISRIFRTKTYRRLSSQKHLMDFPAKHISRIFPPTHLAEFPAQCISRNSLLLCQTHHTVFLRKWRNTKTKKRILSSMSKRQ